MIRLHNIQQSFFGLLAAGFLTAQLTGFTAPLPLQVVLLAVLVTVLGLPHGALDPLVAYRNGFWKRPIGLIGFLVGYTLMVAAVVGFWIWLPPAALSGFLLLAAWHFSGDWEDTLSKALRLAPGALIVSGPALFHPVETSAAFAMLTSLAPADLLVSSLQWLAIPAVVGTAVASATSLRRHPATALELLLLLTLVAFLPPLLFFIVYFCGLHSPRHLIDAIKGLRPTMVTGTAVLFTGIALGAGVLAFFILPGAQVDTRLVQIIFIGLAALTVPHMTLVECREHRSTVS